MTWSLFSEVGRKLIHVTIVVVLAAYFFIQSEAVSRGYAPAAAKQAGLLFLVLLLIVFLVLEFLRLELGWQIPFFWQFVKPKEQNTMYGVIYFLSGATIALAVFDENIALAALLMAAFGDAIAALVGRRYARPLIYRNKSWAGSLAELTVNLFVGFAVLESAAVVATMAFVATAAETLVDGLDDNLVVPLCSGFAGQIVVFLYVALPLGGA